MAGTGAGNTGTGSGTLGGSAGGGAVGGWQGLQGILDFLSRGNINQQSYTNLGTGATGRAGFGAVGSGAQGAFTGLSPYAAQWIQQTLMQKNPAVMDSLFASTNADGTPLAAGQQGAALTGHDLLMAQLHNSLAAIAPATYGLNSQYKDLSAKDLIDTITGMNGQVAGHNFFARGYNDTGETYANRYDQYTHRHSGHDLSYDAWVAAHKKLK